MSWLRKKCVVVPIDFSAESFQALTLALEITGDASCLYVICVLARFPAAEPGIIWNNVDDRTRKYHAALALRGQLSEPEYRGIHIYVEIGDPSAEILDYAKAVEAELIALHARSSSQSDRFLLGSVAERIVRFAHCPVLVLR